MNKFWAGMAALTLVWGVTDARAGGFPEGPGSCEPPGLSADTPTAFDQTCEGRAYEGFYADGGYMLWWLQRDPLPPLITSGNTTINPTLAGALGQSSTQVLFGGTSYGGEGHNGGRLTFGYTAQGIGVQASGFALQQKTVRYNAANGGGPNDPLLGIPFYSASGQGEDVYQVSVPGVQSGSISVALASRLYGGDVSLTGDLLAGPGYHVTALGGFRFLELDESLQESSSAVSLPVGGIPGPNQTTSDNFATYNHFYGGQVGLDAEAHGDRFGIEFIGKLAIGVTTEESKISGSGVIVDPILGTTTTQGLFAQATNGGQHRYGQFALAPEMDLRLSYLVARTVKLSFGYSFLDIDHVARIGDVLNRVTTNPFIPNLVPQTQPSFSRGDSNFWAHGLDFSVAIGF
jgi:hypothetical protein